MMTWLVGEPIDRGRCLRFTQIECRTRLMTLPASAAAAQQICFAQTLLEVLYIIVTKSGAAAGTVSKCRIQYRI